MNWLTGLIGLPVVASPIVYMVGQRRVQRPMLLQSRWLALAILLALWGMLGLTAAQAGLNLPQTIAIGGVALYLDGMSLLMTLLILVLATGIVLFSGADITDEPLNEKYYATMLVLTGSMIGLVCAADLFNLWVWFEVTAISSYLLVAYHQHDSNALAACIKYFVQTTVGSILVLFAMALVLAQTGTLDLATMPVTPSAPLVVAGALFIIGFGVKAALVPNYTWLPDTYTEAPAPVSALLSGAVTVTALIALMRVLGAVSGSPEQWGSVLIMIGVLNIIVGNMLALPQTQVKRILAYSSVCHIGFMVMAFGIGITLQSADGMQSGLLHLWVHGLMKALAFLAVGGLAYGWRRGSQPMERLTIYDLRGAARHYPMIALALTLALLSLAGVPPLAGFYSKLRILSTGVSSGSAWIVAVIVFAALNSVFSLAYYLPIINALYKMDGEPQRYEARPLPLMIRAPVYGLMLLIVLFGLAPVLLDGLIVPAGAALLAIFGG